MEAKHTHFSIIIPAHNEEKYILKTLQHITKLKYPKDKYEVIVVENGSTDKTFEKILEVESNNIKAHSIKQKGISIAKNFGAKKANQKADWLIFLDADTLMGEKVLLEIHEYLTKHKLKQLSVGTTELHPIENGCKHWFWLFDLVHTGGIQIVNKKIFDKINYIEDFNLREDLQLVKDMRKHGKFFYIPTKNVMTSTRRIKRHGIVKLFLKNMYFVLLPRRLKNKVKYEVVR